MSWPTRSPTCSGQGSSTVNSCSSGTGPPFASFGVHRPTPTRTRPFVDTDGTDTTAPHEGRANTMPVESAQTHPLKLSAAPPGDAAPPTWELVESGDLINVC